MNAEPKLRPLPELPVRDAAVAQATLQPSQCNAMQEKAAMKAATTATPISDEAIRRLLATDALVNNRRPRRPGDPTALYVKAVGLFVCLCRGAGLYECQRRF